MVSLTELRLRAARAAIAAVCTPPLVDAHLGAVVLRADQRLSAGRVLDAIARHGGCLLADDVGRGKTYVALAVARRWTRPLVVAPAALRSMWRGAIARSGVACTLVSHEELSRGRLPADLPDGIVVDESHHFRSTSTRRYSALATLSAAARLLLLSATPLQNRARDLAAQIALFHGARAFALDAPALAAFVVRAGQGDAAFLPAVVPPRWVHPAADDGAVLEAILALPPPATPADGGDAGVLRMIGLVRAWASSRAALRAAVAQRRRIAAAIESSAAEGRLPSRRELAAWHGTGAAIQLGFATMLASAAPARAAELLAAVAGERAGLDRLDAALAASADPDEARVAVLRDIRRTHGGDRVLAFTELAATARGYAARLRDAPRVGVLTARGAAIASGRLPRDALLDRFAPNARRVSVVPEHERVTLLVTTDLLSEGVDLQDAGVVVHLDLPWNPARLAQRVGRVRRPGGATLVHAYLVAPPAGAAHLLDVERRLRDKLGAAARAIGRGVDVLPRLAPGGEPPSTRDGLAVRRGGIAERIARWVRPDGARPCRGRTAPIVAGVACGERGWLAALDDGRLVAVLGNGAPDTGDAVTGAVRLAEGLARVLLPGEASAALDDCRRWIDAEQLARRCGHVPAARTLDAAVDRRVVQVVQRVPRHQRAAAAAFASGLMAGAGTARPLGAERALEALLGKDAGGVEWLARAAHVVSTSPRATKGVDRAPRVVALIALG